MPEKNTQNYIIIHKTLKNLLLTFLIIWGIILFGEAILPEFITTKISLLRLILVIFIIIFFIEFIGRKIEKIKPPESKDQKIFLFISVFFVIIVLGLSLLKFDYFSNITIILTTLLILFYFYKELLRKE